MIDTIQPKAPTSSHIVGLFWHYQVTSPSPLRQLHVTRPHPKKDTLIIKYDTDYLPEAEDKGPSLLWARSNSLLHIS